MSCKPFALAIIAQICMNLPNHFRNTIKYHYISNLIALAINHCINLHVLPNLSKMNQMPLHDTPYNPLQLWHEIFRITLKHVAWRCWWWSRAGFFGWASCSSQPPSWSLWKCQDSQEQQLLSIRKLIVANFFGLSFEMCGEICDKLIWKIQKIKILVDGPAIKFYDSFGKRLTRVTFDGARVHCHIRRAKIELRYIFQKHYLSNILPKFTSNL